MSIPSVLATGRRLADQLMVDACTLQRTTGAVAQDETTGRVAPVLTTVYTGPCQVRTPTAQAQTPESGERTATLQRLVVKLPWTHTDVAVGDLVTVTSAAHDPDLVGRSFRVTALHHKTFATARKLDVQETTA